MTASISANRKCIAQVEILGISEPLVISEYTLTEVAGKFLAAVEAAPMIYD
ncbi:MAG: hypothetical protein AAGJ81_01330 [Verrucomicrobiota bacterium]